MENEIRGRPPDERGAVRQARARLVLDSLLQWFERCLTKLSRKSDTTAAVKCALSLWPALVRYCDDGHLEIDNNAAERALRAVAARQQELSVRPFGYRRQACRRHL